MSRLAAVAFALSLLMAACVSPLHDVASDKPFVDWYMNMATQAKADPDYHRIPLDTDAQAQEFVNWLHAVYRGQMSRDQFLQTVRARYPGHDNEANFILSRMPPQPGT